MSARRLLTTAAASLIAALVLAVPAATEAAPAAPAPSPVQITAVTESGYPTVEAVVSAPGGLDGAGYAPSAFTVKEDGKPVRASVERMPTKGLQVLLVLDTSGSMEGAPLAAGKAAANDFITRLPADVEVGVVAFGSRPALIAAPTTDRRLMSSQIGGLQASGETALYDAVRLATTSFTPAAKSRAVVLLSDGGDTVSAASVDQAIAAAAGVRINIIELATGETNRPVLDRLAAAGGGRVSAAGDPAGLTELYRQAAAQLVNQYRITYRSTAHGKADLTVEIATSRGTLSGTANAVLPVAPTTTAPAPATSTPPTTAVTPHAKSPVADKSDASRLPLLVGGVAIFAALLLLGLLIATTDRKVRVARAHLGVQQRVTEASSLTHLADRMTVAADDYLERRGRRRSLATTLEVAGISLRPGELVVIVIAVGLALGLLGLIAAGAVGLIAALVLAPLAAYLTVRTMASRRKAKFAELLPDTLQLLISTIRSGYGLLQALDSAAEEAAEPARTELRRVLLEIRVGRDPGAALHALADRMECKDFQWVVGAIDINREVGGDLATVLDNTADTIRDRQRTIRQMRALTAEGRLSAYVLTVLPVFLALSMKFTNPDSFDKLTHGVGLAMVGGCCVLLGLGWVWMRRLIRIEF